MANLIERMLRPSFEPGFLMRVTWRTIETLQIAFVGTVIGVLLSLPIAWLASRTLSPIGPFRHVFKVMISLFRTVPDIRAEWGGAARLGETLAGFTAARRALIVTDAGTTTCLARPAAPAPNPALPR